MADLGSVDIDLRDLSANVAQVAPRVRRAIRAAFAHRSTRAVAYARQNAPWTDRTSNARNGLYATVQSSPDTYRLVIGHGVPYGIWLEVRFSGRFGIIRRTVDHEGPLLMTMARTLVARELST